MPHAGLAAVILGVTLITVLHFVFRANKQQNAHQYYEDTYSSYSSRRESTVDSQNCPICLYPLGDGRRYVLKDCQHEFHKRCIDKWRDYVKVYIRKPEGSTNLLLQRSSISFCSA